MQSVHTGAHLLGGHLATENSGGGEVAPVSWVGGTHHVFGVPHLLGQLRHRPRAVLLAAARGQRGKAHHEEVQAGKGDQVHGQLAQVRVQLACKNKSYTTFSHYSCQCTLLH